MGYHLMSVQCALDFYERDTDDTIGLLNGFSVRARSVQCGAILISAPFVALSSAKELHDYAIFYCYFPSSYLYNYTDSSYNEEMTLMW